MEYYVRPLDPINSSDITQAVNLQKKIFHQEQGFYSVNISSFAEDPAIRAYGLFCQNILLGYCQYRHISATELKLERVCVSSLRRGKGVGKQLITDSLNDLRQCEQYSVVLESQVQCVEFYYKLGFQPESTEMYLGRPHVRMHKTI